ncbi:MAG TPA: GNAT family N-acetyltransferase [Burkholderiales bacterium]|nr:GNAT family N-acetyltransferase [Burkholderiales bacterium]
MSLTQPDSPRTGEQFAMPPYPRELEQQMSLAGLDVLLRPIRPEDASAYADFIARTAAEDLRMRFFTLRRRLPAKDLARYTEIDYQREMAFVALPEKGSGEILGEVRIYCFSDGATAEFALLVRSDVQRRGLGRALLAKAIEYSRARGATALLGQMRPDNEAMIALARALGMQVEVTPDVSFAVAHLDLAI